MKVEKAILDAKEREVGTSGAKGNRGEVGAKIDKGEVEGKGDKGNVGSVTVQLNLLTRKLIEVNKVYDRT